MIKGSVKAETVRVCGTFDGKIEAKKVALTKAARMTGEIYYETLEIEPGASVLRPRIALPVRGRQRPPHPA